CAGGGGWCVRGHLEEALTGLLGSLLDREGHLLGLPVAEADAAVPVADHDQRGEREPAAALDHLGDPVDVDDAGLVQRGITRGPRVLGGLALAGGPGATAVA